MRDIIRLAGDKMTVFAGVLGYESFWLGAEGWVAVCSNVIPRWSAELFNLVADKRDMDAALALYMKMTPLLWWVGGPRYVSGTKAAFEMMGMPMGPPRAPRLPLPEAQRPALREVLRQMGVLPRRRRAPGRSHPDIDPHYAPYGAHDALSLQRGEARTLT